MEFSIECYRFLEFNLIFNCSKFGARNIKNSSFTKYRAFGLQNSHKRNCPINQHPLDHRSMCCSDTFLIHVSASPTWKATLTRTRSTSCQTSYTLITFLISPRTIPFHSVSSIPKSPSLSFPFHHHKIYIYILYIVTAIFDSYSSPYHIYTIVFFNL